MWVLIVLLNWLVLGLRDFVCWIYLFRVAVFELFVCLFCLDCQHDFALLWFPFLFWVFRLDFLICLFAGGLMVFAWLCLVVLL